MARHRAKQILDHLVTIAREIEEENYILRNKFVTRIRTIGKLLQANDHTFSRDHRAAAFLKYLIRSGCAELVFLCAIAFGKRKIADWNKSDHSYIVLATQTTFETLLSGSTLRRITSSLQHLIATPIITPPRIQVLYHTPTRTANIVTEHHPPPRILFQSHPKASSLTTDLTIQDNPRSTEQDSIDLLSMQDVRLYKAHFDVLETDAAKNGLSTSGLPDKSAQQEFWSSQTPEANVDVTTTSYLPSSSPRETIRDTNAFGCSPMVTLPPSGPEITPSSRRRMGHRWARHRKRKRG